MRSDPPMRDLRIQNYSVRAMAQWEAVAAACVQKKCATGILGQTTWTKLF